MIIKRNISFFLQKVYNDTNNGESQIRMRARWSGNIAQFNCGYTIDPKKWDHGISRCKKNAFNKKGYSSAEINKELNRLEELAHDVFKAFEVQEHIPDAGEFRDNFNCQNGKKVNASPTSKTLDSCFHEFITTQSVVNSWSVGTLAKFRTLKKHLLSFDENLKLADFNQSIFIRFVDYLLRDMGFRNTSAQKEWKLLKWFLGWADRHGYLQNKDYQDFTPRLKTVSDKEVVYLAWDELMRVYNLQFPVGKKYLERARDVFCFQCFTSLRYSDVAKLKREDIGNDVVKVVTAKTGDTIKIDLNKYSRAILERYADEKSPLPIISNQKMNQYVKEVCYIAGIDSPVTIVYYKGAERIEEVHPKYELIGTHTGRRTFICNALSMGIPASTVMEWTGHSDYKAMKPYVKIADKEKAKAMKAFDER